MLVRGETRRRGPRRWPPIGPLAERERSGARAAGTGSVLKEPVGFDGPIEGSTGVYVEADNEVGVFLDGEDDSFGAVEEEVSYDGRLPGSARGERGADGFMDSSEGRRAQDGEVELTGPGAVDDRDAPLDEVGGGERGEDELRAGDVEVVGVTEV